MAEWAEESIRHQDHLEVMKTRYVEGSIILVMYSGIQFIELKPLIDIQTEFLEIFMQQKYEIIIFSSNNLLETYKI